MIRFDRVGALLIVAVSAIACGSHGGGTENTASKSSTSEALNTAPTSTDFVLYAQRSISIGSHDSVNGGDIGVRSPTVAGFGPQMIVSDHVSIDSANNLLAPSVSLGAHSVVGDVQTNALSNGGAILGAQGTFPASSMPPVPLATTPLATGANLNVASHQAITLSPGVYGALAIADHAAVTLSAGTYSFSSATIGENTAISANAAGVTIQIAGSLAIAGSSSIAPSGGGASKLNISVAGADASSTLPAVGIGSHASLVALIAAPGGTIAVADHVAFTGAFAAFDISISNNSSIQFQSGFSPTAAGQVGSQQLSGYTNAPVAGAPIVGPVPPSTPVSVGVGLSVKNAAGLQTFALAVSDPTNALYQQYLTLDQFAGSYGAAPADYNALASWAETNGLTVTAYANNLFVDVAGTAADINRVLHVELNYALRSDGTQFFEPDRQPSVDLTTTVMRVSGLDNLVVPQSFDSGSGSASNGGLLPSDLQAAYLGCTSLRGEDQRVGIFSTDLPWIPDVNAFKFNSGLLNNTPVVSVPVAGFNGTVTLGTKGVTEATGDIESVLSIAPNLKQVLIFVGGDSGQSSTLMAMANRTDIHQFSDSFWWGPLDANAQQAILEMAVQGQSLFVASGDGILGSAFGGFSLDPQDIRDSYFATNVGGTDLNVAGGVVTSETGWSGSGGGVLSSVDVPLYQLPLLNPGNPVSLLFRGSPDVAMPSSGLFQWQNGKAALLGGTSYASPLWAGFTAILNESAEGNGQKDLGFVNAKLYQLANSATLYPSTFNDIVSGNNGFQAFTGYDYVTGLGSPRCGLVQEVANPTVGPAPTIGVAVKGNVGASPDVCITGTGFPAGASISIGYFGLPSSLADGSTVDIDLPGNTTVSNNGTFSVTQIGVYSVQPCTSDELNSEATISIAGGAGGAIGGATAPTSFWCQGGRTDTYGGVCQ